jgi:hypothetical protein
VSTIAGALRRRVWIDERFFQWTPNFYIVLVAPPGVVAKSTSVRIGLKLLEQVEGVKFGPKSLTWQGLAKALQDAEEHVALTPTAVLDGEDMLPMSCLTCSVNELGTFLRPENGEMLDFFTDVYDGQKGIWDRALATQDGYKIINGWVNVIAATTPGWLRRNYTESMIEGGLTSRILFVYADKKRHLTPYLSDVIEEKKFEEQEKRLVEDLREIALLVGEYDFTEEAKQWGRDWYKTHWTRERPEHMASDRYAGYIARKQTHMHKLAIVIAASKRDELVIHRTDMEVADQMVSGLEQSMTNVFQSIGMADTSRNAMEIIAYVRAFKGISADALFKYLTRIMEPKQYQESLDMAVRAKYIKTEVRGNVLHYVPIVTAPEKSTEADPRPQPQ